MKALLGGKGANLAEMSNLGLPVPPGFTITTEVCTCFYANDRTLSRPSSTAQVDAALAPGRAASSARASATRSDPLLVSVRSGAPVSMPGMMDTVLNLGLNDATVEGLAAASGDARFACDSYRRFIQMYGDVVLGVDHDLFEEALDDAKQDQRRHARHRARRRRPGASWSRRYKAIVAEASSASRFPQDAAASSCGARSARCSARWMTTARGHLPPAARHPERHGAPRSTSRRWCSATWATTAPPASPSPATRRPARSAFYGEFLVNAQGEDVVAGIRTPQPLTRAMAARRAARPAGRWKRRCPRRSPSSPRCSTGSSAHYRDMQDIEFTIAARQALDAADPHRQAHRARRR